MAKVSVIIPCYNQGEFIDEAVDSVLAQTFQDFEIVIVNDGSTDEYTNDLLSNYSKPKTKVIHTTNQGLSAARNNGIKVAKGEYILPLDADDKIADRFIERAFDEITKNTDIAIVSTNWLIFGEKAALSTSFANSVSCARFKGGNAIDFLLNNNTMSCGLFSKRIWIQVGGYNENMRNGYEDWDFWLNITKNGYKSFVIEDPLYYYRVKTESMNMDADQKRPELIKQLVSNHIELFQKYVSEAILLREEVIQKQNNYLNNLKGEVKYLNKIVEDLQKTKIYRLNKMFTKIKRKFKLFSI